MSMPKPWFKTKQSSWFYYPITWQGWAVTAVYFCALIIRFWRIYPLAFSMRDALIWFAPYFCVITIAFFLIIWQTKENKEILEKLEKKASENDN